VYCGETVGWIKMKLGSGHIYCVRWEPSSPPPKGHSGTGTFRAQDLSSPRTNSPYGELSFLRLFIPGNFRSLGTKVPRNFRSWALSFSFVSGERKPFVPKNFRSQELLFLRLFCKALAMNTDSYSNCQNLFRSRPSSVRFLKIN